MIDRENGFTLIEVLVAVMVMAIAFLAMYQMQTMAVRGNETGHQVTIATMLAQDKMEEKLIRKALEKTRGNKTKAAKLLEISHPWLLT